MPPTREQRKRSVFLNVPYDLRYEKLFVAQISALVALGRIPRCVLELPETGQGRLARILELIQSCGVSIHDVSRVGVPVRFNMPFELGIAVALNRFKGWHQFVILEAERYRVIKTLSDVNGMDPGIHGAKVDGVISCVFSHLGSTQGNPSVESARSIYRDLWKAVPKFKEQHGRENIYSRAIFGQLVAGASILAKTKNLVRT